MINKKAIAALTSVSLALFSASAMCYVFRYLRRTRGFYPMVR